MIAILARIGAGILGIATFLLAYLWILSFFLFHRLLEHHPRTEHLSKDAKRRIAFGLTAAGGVAIWLAFEYVLPSWWLAATPIVNYGD